jgi:hypothetical protein
VTLADLRFVDEGVKLAVGAPRPTRRRQARSSASCSHRHPNLPGCGVADVAGGRRHYRWCGVSRGRSPRPDRHDPVRPGHRANRQAARGGSRHRSDRLLGALAARRMRHRGSRTRGRGTRHRPSYPPPLDPSAAWLHPGGDGLREQRLGTAGTLIGAVVLVSRTDR